MDKFCVLFFYLNVIGAFGQSQRQYCDSHHCNSRNCNRNIVNRNIVDRIIVNRNIVETPCMASLRDWIRRNWNYRCPKNGIRC
jgi:hypothetical protein